MKEDNWISVEDRLPEIGEDVLTWDKSTRQIRFLDKVSDDVSYFSTNTVFGTTYDVTHWQPLPEPPKTK